MSSRRRPPLPLRPGQAGERIGLQIIRFWLPLVVTLVGVVFMVVAHDLAGLEGGALIVSAGLSIWLLNWLYRVGIAGEGERRAEDDARAFFVRHGHWPDEPGPGRPLGERPADSEARPGETASRRSSAHPHRSPSGVRRPSRRRR